MNRKVEDEKKEMLERKRRDLNVEWRMKKKRNGEGGRRRMITVNISLSLFILF